MAEARRPADRLLAVAAGAPGVVDLDRGVVVLAPNLEGWSAVPMRDTLRQALGAPVLVENDVNLALLGEHWKGAARGHDTCAFLFVGTGIGAAVLIDGTLHRGHHFMAGRDRRHVHGPRSTSTSTGTHGCLETLAGLRALAAQWPEATEGDPDAWLPRVFEAARSGDARAREAIRQTATLLGIAAANIGTVVDPSVIVLGGALFANAGPLAGHIRTIVERFSRAPVEIRLAGLGKDAPLAGCLLVAATHARETLRERVWRILADDEADIPARGLAIPQARVSCAGSWRLRDFDDLVRRPRSLPRRGPVGPADLDHVGVLRGAEPDVQAHVVLRQVAGPALHEPPCTRPPLRAVRMAPIAFVLPRAAQLHDQPVARARGLVAQHLGLPSRPLTTSRAGRRCPGRPRRTRGSRDRAVEGPPAAARRSPRTCRSAGCGRSSGGCR
jgi:glucokinase